MRKIMVSAVLGALVTALTVHWVVSKQSERVTPRAAKPAPQKSAPRRSAVSAATAERPPAAAARIHGAVAEAARVQELEHRAAARPTSPAGLSPSEYPEFLEFSFDQEDVDVTWAKDTESRIHGALTKLPDVKIVRAECRSTLCRFEVTYGSNAAAETFATDYVQSEPFNGTSGFEQRVRGPNGLPTGMIVTFARKGHTLPELAAEPAPPTDQPAD